MATVDARSEIPAPPVPPLGEPDAYAHLARRAESFVRDRGGSAHEDALIAHVFGSTGSAALWRPLLRKLIGPNDGITLRADGYWTIPGAEPTADGTLLDDYVVVDVETTGLRPARQRVIEIAAIRFRGGTEVGRVETLLNPGRRLPKYIVEMTGIRDEDLANAPRFGDIARDVLDLIGSTLVVGHNVGFDFGFLNAELKLAGQPALVNESIDTLGLAMSLLTGLRKPNLASVAQALGVPPVGRKLHRAGADAVLTAEVARRLVGLAQERGARSVDALKAMGARRPAREKEKIGRGRAVLDRSLLADVPRVPGVYLMRDAFDQIIYVGKAKNLRDRVASYYSQPLGYTRKMDGLLESLTRIEIEVVGSELEALLLEAQLIRRYQPRYNTALRSSERYPYIRVDVANAWPRITLAKSRKEDGARYFGPFRNTSGARKTVDLINRVVPLRTCSRSFKDARSYGSPCLELDLGRCLGPCVGRADRETYAGLVHDATRFLDGRDEALYEILWRGLEEAAEKLDFERAARLRQDLLQVTSVVGAQRRLREAAETQTLVLVLPSAAPGARELMLVVGGRLWAQLRAFPDDGEAGIADRLGLAWGRLGERGALRIDHDSLDETHILNRWLLQNSGHPAIFPIEPPPAQPAWRALVGRAFALSDEQLAFEARSVDLDDTVEELTPPEQSDGIETRPAASV